MPVLGSGIVMMNRWSGVRGPHGYGVANDAGRELLSFLSSHQATICNIYKKEMPIAILCVQSRGC